MEIELCIQQKKEFYSSLMNFIGSPDDFETDFLTKCFEKYEILQNKEEELLTLKLLSKIFSNHHRTPYFLNKFEQNIRIFIQRNKKNINI